MQKKADIINQIKDLILLLDIETQRKLALELVSKVDFQEKKKADADAPKPWEKFGKWPGLKWNREECYEERTNPDRY